MTMDDIQRSKVFSARLIWESDYGMMVFRIEIHPNLRRLMGILRTTRSWRSGKKLLKRIINILQADGYEMEDQNE